jgi:copper transport protein
MSGETLAFAFGAIGRWVSYLSVVTIVGAAGLAVYIKPALNADTDDQAAHVVDRVIRIAVVATIALLGSTMWRLYAQAYSVFGLDEVVTWEHLRIVALETSWGRGWVSQLGTAGLAAVLLVSALATNSARSILVAVAAVAAAVTIPMTGHAMSRSAAVAWPSVLVQVLHVVGVGLWIGTLFMVVASLRHASTKVFTAAVKAFSPLAFIAVTTIAVTGAITALTYLESFSELWSTVYGRTLFLKIVLFGATGALGAYNWRRLRSVSDPTGQAGFLRRTAGAELLIAWLTLAVTAVLVALPLSHG